MLSSGSALIGLIIASLATVASQTLFKHATTVVTVPEGSSFAMRFWQLLWLPSFEVALLLYGLSFVVWVWLLSKSPLSILYPVALSMNVVFAIVAARWFLGESLTLIHGIGIAVIIVGIFLVAR
jgi:multidrug transporter EmrE-like cation transporter